MDTVVTLQSQDMARVLVERRCVKCGMWLSGSDLGHSSLAQLTQGICQGKGAGKFRRRVFVTTLTERQRIQVENAYSGHPEFHPLLKWRKATLDEKREAVCLTEET